jgi:hypothetical protein
MDYITRGEMMTFLSLIRHQLDPPAQKCEIVNKAEILRNIKASGLGDKLIAGFREGVCDEGAKNQLNVVVDVDGKVMNVCLLLK